MNLRRYIGTGAAVVLLVASWHGTRAGVTPAPVPVPSSRPAPAPAPLAIQGAGSCSATACHGSMAPAARDAFPSRVLRNEHTTWVTQDRHANAYRVLTTKRSDDMASRVAGHKVSARQEGRCLVCHATGGVSPTAANVELIRSDGISCESCHGPAERWLTVHTQYGWTSVSPHDKEALGMRPTRELAQRAAICVECHVGASDRDMNHDLIAAGHPRLNFEFAAFLANMPAHWVEDTSGNFNARAWAIGQAVTAKAGVDLLANRASHAGAGPWPEFSEYNCFACHHDLADEQWRQQPPAAGRTPGIPAWGTWLYPAALTLAHHDNRGDLEKQFAALRSDMNHLGADPAKAAAAAREVSQALARWLQTLPQETRTYDASKVKALLESVRTKDAPGAAEGWDGAAQRYLALQPLRLSLKGLDPTWSEAPLDAELKSLFKSLQFTPKYNSPRRYEPVHPSGSR